MRVRLSTGQALARFPFGIRGFQYHLERLRQGCAVLELPCPPEQTLVKNIHDVIACTPGPIDLKLKVAVTFEGFSITHSPFEPRLHHTNGAAILTIQAQRSNPQIKSLDTTVSQMAQKFAVQMGADEALLYDSNGIVREGAWSNFFWVSDSGELITPAHSILPGVTRRLILEGLQMRVSIREQDFSLEQVKARICEAFITNALHGVIPVRALDGISLARGTYTELASQVLERLTFNQNSY